MDNGSIQLHALLYLLIFILSSIGCPPKMLEFCIIKRFDIQACQVFSVVQLVYVDHVSITPFLLFATNLRNEFLKSIG